MLKIIILSISFGVLSGCATSGYKQYYKPIGDLKNLTDVQFLQDGQEPKIFSANDMDTDVKVAISKGFVPIGASSFNGELAPEKEVIDQAKRVKAVMALVNSKFTENRQITAPLILPNNRTTYSSGSVYGAYGATNYSGTSTTYGTQVIPFTQVQQRYDQNAIFFAKSTKKPKFGLFFNDLSPDLRARYQRNTGAVISIVMEESPAFYANMLPGDVMIELNGQSVLNQKSAFDLMTAASYNSVSTIKVIRDGEEKIFSLSIGNR